jgi:hypothetical protein
VAFKKHFRLSRYQLTAQFDLYNALNAAPVQTDTQVFGSQLGFPNTILQGRLPRLVAQIRW